MSDSEQILPESTTIQSDSNLDDLNKVPENHTDSSNDSSSTTSSQASSTNSSFDASHKKQTARKHTISQFVLDRENYSPIESSRVRQTARKSTSPPFCRVTKPTARKQVKRPEYMSSKQTARKLTSSMPVRYSSGPRIEIDTAHDFEPSILHSKK